MIFVPHSRNFFPRNERTQIRLTLKLGKTSWNYSESFGLKRPF